MEKITLPIEEILKNRKNGYYNQHYFYSNGDYEITFSHLSDCLTLMIYDINEKKVLKELCIRNITKSSLTSLENRVNTFLMKKMINEKFYDVYGDKTYNELYNKIKNLDIIEKEYGDIEIEMVRGDKYKININNLSEKIIINEEISITCFILNDSSKIKLYKYMEKIIEGNI